MVSLFSSVGYVGIFAKPRISGQPVIKITAVKNQCFSLRNRLHFVLKNGKKMLP